MLSIKLERIYKEEIRKYLPKEMVDPPSWNLSLRVKKINFNKLMLKELRLNTICFAE